MSNAAKIESILFYKAGPVKITYLMQMLNLDRDAVEAALGELTEGLAGRGVQLQRIEESVQLATTPETADIIEQIAKHEVTGDLGRAGLETLTIILYYGPVTRAEIDYIRGVNSTYSLRILLVRGLVERFDNKTDKRAHLYKPTFETLQLLGVNRAEDLPDFEALRTEVTQFAEQTEDDTEQETDSE